MLKKVISYKVNKPRKTKPDGHAPSSTPNCSGPCKRFPEDTEDLEVSIIQCNDEVFVSGMCVSAEMSSRAGEVEELYFNVEATDSSCRDFDRCNKERCTQTIEVSPRVRRVDHTNTVKVDGFSQYDGSAQQGSCGSASSDCREQLQATMRVLSNKEETVQIQAASLREAEARLAALHHRNTRLADQLRGAQQQLSTLQEAIELKKMQKTDVAVSARSQADCTCGLVKENQKLKDKNAELETDMIDLQQKIQHLESTLSAKDNRIEEYRQELDAKTKELQQVREELQAVRSAAADSEERLRHDLHQRGSCVQLHLEETQALLNDKTVELSVAQEQCRQHEATIKNLKEDLNKAEKLIREECKVRSEVSYLSRQVSRWRAQLSDSDARAARLQAQLDDANRAYQELQECYKIESSSSRRLQEELVEATSRGARLCGESRAALQHLRGWARRMRAAHGEQQEKIALLERELAILRARGEKDDVTYCDERTCPHSRSVRAHELRDRCDVRDMCDVRDICDLRDVRSDASAEVASCSTAPVPPRRRIKTAPSVNKSVGASCAACSPSRKTCSRCGRTDDRQLSECDSALCPSLRTRVNHVSGAHAERLRRWTDTR